MTQENKPSITLAFDVYGTLINTQGVVTALQKLIGDKAEEFSRTWREKQLEYSFRRGLMRDYEQFSICISNALDYTCAYYKTPLTETQKNELRGEYKSAEWGNQIRSYVLQPYKMVKDLRSKFETTDPENILEGNLDEIIEAYLKFSKAK